MRYENLNELVRGSRSSARYFFSLSAEMQIKVAERGAFIHSAQDLHDAARAVEIYEHAVKISARLTPRKR